MVVDRCREIVAMIIRPDIFTAVRVRGHAIFIANDSRSARAERLDETEGGAFAREGASFRATYFGTSILGWPGRRVA